MSIRIAVVVAAAGLLASTSVANPLFPTITGHDINFGAYNGVNGPVEWLTNGADPDTLVFTRQNPEFGPRHNEATAYWPAWPNPPVVPVFNFDGSFGGDVYMNVRWVSQDAPYVGGPSTIDVSLNGVGNDPQGFDFAIYGTVGNFSGLLWALRLDVVSLYGYSGGRSYTLEGGGIIVGGLLANNGEVIGHTGVIRGQVDFLDRPAGWIPSLYDPMVRLLDVTGIRMSFSGETGEGTYVPAPSFAGLLGLGALAAMRRRR